MCCERADTIEHEDAAVRAAEVRRVQRRETLLPRGVPDLCVVRLVSRCECEANGRSGSGACAAGKCVWRCVESGSVLWQRGCVPARWTRRGSVCGANACIETGVPSTSISWNRKSAPAVVAVSGTEVRVRVVAMA